MMRTVTAVTCAGKRSDSFFFLYVSFWPILSLPQSLSDGGAT